MQIRKLLLGAVIAAAGLSSPALAFEAHFSNGRQIWSSANSGASFAQSGVVNSVSDLQTLGTFGVVALGYHATTDTFFASGSNGHLYTVGGLGTAAVNLTFFKNLGDSSISFEFFGNEFRGVRGNDLISFDIVSNSALTVLNANTGQNNVPATAGIGSDYYGMNSAGNVYLLNSVGAATLIGATGQGSASQAGGAGWEGSFYAGLGFDTAGANDQVRFGTIDVGTGAFSLISSTNIGEARGQMGLVIVPNPSAAVLLGLGALVATRRRR